jgi:HB1, ASXL, restriction endonuclease HTH domain
MANKKLLGNGTSELRLPAKKGKGEKKPKWQAKTGGKKSKEVEVAEPVEAVVETPALEVEQLPEATTPATMPTDEVASEPAPTVEPTEAPTNDEQTPATDPEPTPAKPKKLKVKADLKPKKLSMIKAALQVLQDSKVPMTCPELIDVMAMEGLWVSPGGKTPASTLYAAISRSIKDEGKSSPFRKTERGKFEAKVLAKE